MPKGAVVVARPSKWGNPFRVGDTYEDMNWLTGEWVELPIRDAATAVAVFRQSIGKGCTFEAEVRAELAGKDLACWCPLDQPCHADVLLEIANSPEGTR